MEENNIVSKKKNNNKIIIVLLITATAISLFLGGFFVAKNFISNKNNSDEKDIKKPKIIKTKDVKKLTLFQVSVNGITISFPSNKYEFEAAGWKWDKEKAKTDLASGYSMPGGRIGEAPGGVVVSVTNLSGKTQVLEDCIIDDGDFYNSNSKDKVFFVGGLNYNSTEDDVRNTLTNLGYKNVVTRNYENSNYYDYYLDDNKENFKDHISFYFYKGKIKSVSIYTTAK